MVVSSSSSSSYYTVTKLLGNFGRLWKPSHENLASQRRILQIQGPGATAYLQGLITSDLFQAPIPPREEKVGGEETGQQQQEGEAEFSDKLRATCFLDNKGRILTDSLLWKVDETLYYVDVPEDTADTLLSHLQQFILRRTKVKVKDMTATTSTGGMSSHVIFGTLNANGTPADFMSAVDPRYPGLGMRVLSLSELATQQLGPMIQGKFPQAPGTYDVVRKLAGVAEGSEIQGKIAGETNQEFLNAVSFSKGCYLGQELTARVQFTGAVRKRVLPVMLMDLNMEIPRPWLWVSQVQQGKLPEGVTPDQDLPRLPRLSPSAVGSIIGVMSQGGGDTKEEDGEKKMADETTTAQEQLAAQSVALMETLQDVQAGDKLVDKEDGKTIGQIIAGPEAGTNVVLAQMRLDRIGLLGQGVWKHTNKVQVGNLEGDYRYLPYLPLWWPEIDRESGKAKEQDERDRVNSWL